MRSRIVSVLFVFFLSVGNVYAVGWNSDYVGLRAAGLSNIYTGVADDSSAVFWNPAGLVQIPEGVIDCNFEFYTGILPDYTYHDATTGQDYSSTDPFGAPSMFGATRRGKLAYGAGFYASYGAGSAVLDNVPGLGDFTTAGGGFSLGLSIAYEVSPKLYLGFTGETALGMLEVKGSRYEDRGVIIDMEQEYLAINTGYRAVFGIMYKPVTDVRIGVTAKSPTSLKYEGDVKMTVVDGPLPPGFVLADDGSATYTVDIPWYLLTGVSYQVTPKMLITAEYAYRWWGDVEFKESEVEMFNGPQKSASPTNWVDSWTLGLGIKYELSPKLYTSGGISYTTHAVESKDKTVASGGTDLSYYNFAIGFGYKITEKIEAVFNTYYYHSEKETDPVGNTYQKTLLGNVMGVKMYF